MSNPYLIHGPALISFSGGRTSAYMLWKILQAHGGTLPDHVYVVFADTGKEHPATYRFIQDCADHWGVEIHTVAYDKGEHDTPFGALIAKKKFLPHPRARFCTEFLKIYPLAEFMQSRGYETWLNVVGIRSDEEHRIANIEKKEKTWASTFPLAFDDVTKSDVMAFWAAQNFDLDLPPGFGNCVFCFMKSRAQLIAIEQSQPGTLSWPASKEKQIGGTFRSDRENYTQLMAFSRSQQFFDFGPEVLDESSTVGCGCTD